jgi:hypothetical protein
MSEKNRHGSPLRPGGSEERLLGESGGGRKAGPGGFPPRRPNAIALRATASRKIARADRSSYWPTRCGRTLNICKETIAPLSRRTRAVSSTRSGMPACRRRARRDEADVRPLQSQRSRAYPPARRRADAPGSRPRRHGRCPGLSRSDHRRASAYAPTWRGTLIGSSGATISARRGSNHGGSSIFSPRCSIGSSMAKPMSQVAISHRIPPGERQ